MEWYVKIKAGIFIYLFIKHISQSDNITRYLCELITDKVTRWVIYGTHPLYSPQSHPAWIIYSCESLTLNLSDVSFNFAEFYSSTWKRDKIGLTQSWIWPILCRGRPASGPFYVAIFWPQGHIFLTYIRWTNVKSIRWISNCNHMKPWNLVSQPCITSTMV